MAANLIPSPWRSFADPEEKQFFPQQNMMRSPNTLKLPCSQEDWSVPWGQGRFYAFFFFFFKLYPLCLAESDMKWGKDPKGSLILEEKREGAGRDGRRKKKRRDGGEENRREGIQIKHSYGTGRFRRWTRCPPRLWVCLFFFKFFPFMMPRNVPVRSAMP